jgi:hypothetical protein
MLDPRIHPLLQQAGRGYVLSCLPRAPLQKGRVLARLLGDSGFQHRSGRHLHTVELRKAGASVQWHTCGLHLHDA